MTQIAVVHDDTATVINVHIGWGPLSHLDQDYLQAKWEGDFTDEREYVDSY